MKENLPTISISDFSFTYAGAKEQALCGISAEIAHGEWILLCGASGSGKTTLLRSLKPEIAPAGDKTGNIRVFEKNIFSLRESTRTIGGDNLSPRESAEKIGFVMQNPDNQIVMDSVKLELAFGPENLGVPADEIGRRIAEIASFFGIESWFEKSVFELSGGQKQILSLAAVIAMQAEIIILDEPTAQLDPIAANEFLHMLKRVNQELGKTIIISEHLLEETLSDSDKVLYLENGRLAYFGDNIEFPSFLSETASSFAAALPAPTRLAVRYEEEVGAMRSEPTAPAAQREQRAFNAQNEPGVYNAHAPYPLNVKQGREWIADRPAPHAACGKRKTSAPHAACGKEKTSAPHADAIISARDIWFRYDKNDDWVLQGLDTEIPSGGIHIYVGGNGSGKSTLLGVLSGVFKPFRGRVSVRKNKDICMLFQDSKSIFLCDTLAEDLREHGIRKGKCGAEHGIRKRKCGAEHGIRKRKCGAEHSPDITEEEVHAIAKKLRIDQFLGRHPYDLSAGEMQKAAIAKVLLLNRDILLLDEPIKGLDAFAKNEIGEILLELKESGITIAMVTHDIEFAAKYADTCSMLFGRSIIANGSAREFFTGNIIYTTAISRMTRGIADGCVLEDDVAFETGSRNE